MSSIADLLKEFSVESAQAEVEENNLVEGQVGAEEILVATDETTTELEEAIEEVADAVEDQEAVAETTETLIEAAESLESAMNIIESATLRGERVNGVAMQIWAQGVCSSMEARQIPAEVYKEIVEGFGDSFESDSYTDYSVEAKEKSEGVMAKIWSMIKSAFARARDFLTRLIAWFGKSADAVEKAGKKLLKAVEDKKGKKVDKDAKILGTPYSELMYSGKFDPARAVNRAKNVFGHTNTQCDTLYDVGVNSAKALEGSGDKKSVITKAGKDTTKALEEMAKNITGFSAGAGKKWEMKVESNSERFWNEGKVVYSLKTEAATKTDPGEVNVPSLDDLKELANNIIALAKDVREKSDNAKRTQGKINIQFGENAKGEQQNLADQRIVARTISSAVAASSSIRGKIAGSVLAQAKKGYAFGMIAARRYK